jgi:hypothetical protein
MQELTTDPHYDKPLFTKLDGSVASEVGEPDATGGFNDGEEKQCRICLLSDGDDFIVPCKCKGSMKYVHRECLDKWRAANVNPQAFSNCTQCTFKYEIVPVVEDEQADKERLNKYYGYLGRDAFIFFGINELIIIFLAFILKWCDTKNGILNTFPDSFRSHWFIIYHLYGIVTYFALIGLSGIMMACAHGTSSGPTCIWCGDCNCKSSGGDDGKCVGILLLVILVILVVIGIFIGIYVCGQFFTKRAEQHRETLWKYQEAKKYIVKDFTGREHELAI